MRAASSSAGDRLRHEPIDLGLQQAHDLGGRFVLGLRRDANRAGLAARVEPAADAVAQAALDADLLVQPRRVAAAEDRVGDRADRALGAPRSAAAARARRPPGPTPACRRSRPPGRRAGAARRRRRRRLAAGAAQLPKWRPRQRKAAPRASMSPARISTALSGRKARAVQRDEVVAARCAAARRACRSPDGRRRRRRTARRSATQRGERARAGVARPSGRRAPACAARSSSAARSAGLRATSATSAERRRRAGARHRHRDERRFQPAPLSSEPPSASAAAAICGALCALGALGEQRRGQRRRGRTSAADRLRRRTARPARRVTSGSPRRCATMTRRPLASVCSTGAAIASGPRRGRRRRRRRTAARRGRRAGEASASAQRSGGAASRRRPAALIFALASCA